MSKKVKGVFDLFIEIRALREERKGFIDTIDRLRTERADFVSTITKLRELVRSLRDEQRRERSQRL